MPTITTVNLTSAIGPPVFGGKGSQSSPIQLVNLDTANTVWLSYTANPSVSQPGSFPLPPLASIAFDGTVSVWGVTAPGETATVGVLPGGSNYSPGSLTITGPVTAEITGPVVISDIEGGNVTFSNDTIDVIGDGGYITPGQAGTIFNATGGTVGPSSYVEIASAIPVATYSSVVLNASGLSNSSAAAGAAVCAVIFLQWLDASSNVIAVDTLSVMLSPGVWSATWELPVKGVAIALNVQNVGTTGNITVPAGGIFMDGAYRVIPNVRALQSLGGTAPTLAGCTVQLQTRPVYSILGWVANVAYTAAGAIASLVIPLPQWAGEVTGFYQVTTTALVRNATIADLSYAVQGGVTSGSGYAYGIIQNLPAAIDASPVPITFNLPPSQCALIIDVAAGSQFYLSLMGVNN